MPLEQYVKLQLICDVCGQPQQCNFFRPGGEVSDPSVLSSECQRVSREGWFVSNGTVLCPDHSGRAVDGSAGFELTTTVATRDWR